MNKNVLVASVVILILVVAGIGVYVAKGGIGMNGNATTTPEGEQVACTMEAMLCPDGSAVGRQGPNCEFAKCPDVTATTSTSTR